MFEVTLNDESTEWVEGAVSYQQEGPMTTFFEGDSRRPALDCWSTKVASYRTDRILRIRRSGQTRLGFDSAGMR